MKSDTEIQVGLPRVRVDGRDKVTGAVRFTADTPVPGAVHAVLLQATIAHGRVIKAELAEALAQPGVLYILTPDNCPRLKELPEELTKDLPAERRPPLSDWNVHYAGQHLALLVAETVEQAEHAASLVRFTYEEEPALLSTVAALHGVGLPHNVGQVQWGSYFPDHFTKMEAEKLQYSRGTVPAHDKVTSRIAETYTSPVEHHNPIETSATIACWEGDRLTVHDTTRWLLGSRKTLAGYLDLPEAKIRILCPFIGGAFGSKSFLWQHVVLTAVAARHLDRPVKLVLSRAQMFTSVGHRPETLQQVSLMGDAEHHVLSTVHDVLSETSTVAHFVEPAAMTSRNLYRSPHASISHKVTRTHRATPVFMRAPGESSGVFALESAMDELAYAFEPPVDPLELRLRNEAHVDQDGDKRFASKNLQACYEAGAERFGWTHRPSAPRSLTRNGLLVGQGMATATYPGRRMAASARVMLSPDGVLVVMVATHELGNGVRTVLSQVAADASGIPIDRVQVLTGDSDFPEAPYTGASQTTATTGPAVQAAAAKMKERLAELASVDRGSPLFGLPVQQITVRGGHLVHGKVSESYMDLLARTRVTLSVEAKAEPPEKMEEVTHESFGAHFVEVEVDEALGMVRVVRWVGVFDGGTILNPMLARSQIMGGIIFGIGMALMEETIYDAETGIPVNASLGEYHVPTHRDVPSFDISFVERPDLRLNPLGVRGVGELGIVGAPAAIANAIFHATGVRHRQLPIRPDRVMRHHSK